MNTADDILKAYNKHAALDDAMHIMNMVDAGLSTGSGGFGPFFWISRRMESNKALEKRRQIEVTEEIMIGQAFGL